MATNFAVKKDPSGNMRPDKGASADKIDGMVAMLMAWGVLIGHEQMPPARWLGFALIWIALSIFIFDA